MKMNWALVFGIPFVLTSNIASAFEIQAHRGGAGKDLHESSQKAFERSLQQGADVLEFDVQLTSDLKFIVSHDSVFSNGSCRCESTSVPRSFSYSFRGMKLSDILSFKYSDDGSTSFPEVESMVESLPLNAVLSIEIKNPKDAGQAEMKKTARLFFEVLQKKNWFQRVIVQSFDSVVLEELHALSLASNNPIRLSYLYMGDAFLNVPLLSKIPLNLQVQWERVFEFAVKNGVEIISPRIHLVKDRSFADLVALRKARAPQMKIIPWTVNTPGDIKKAIQLGCDGVITDNVKMAIEVVKSLP